MRVFPQCVRILAFFLAASVVPAYAHHGKDFLVVETYGLPHPQDIYFVSTQSFVRNRDYTTALEAEPAFLFGISSRFAAEIHSHTSKEGSDPWRHESTALALRYALTPPGGAQWRFNVSAEYEKSHHSDVNNRMEGRLIVARAVGDSNLSFNFIVGRDQGVGASGEYGYAIGYRPDVSRRLGWGLEAQGQFTSPGSHEIIAGLYSEISPRFIVKFGVGKGLGSGSPDFTIRSGVVVKF